MKNDSTTTNGLVPREVWDLRLGGEYNILCVDVLKDAYPGSPKLDDGYQREFWVVQYDRWRDEYWTVLRAWRMLHSSERHLVPVLMRFGGRSLTYMVELMSGTACGTCANERWNRGVASCLKNAEMQRGPHWAACPTYEPSTYLKSRGSAAVAEQHEAEVGEWRLAQESRRKDEEAKR